MSVRVIIGMLGATTLLGCGSVEPSEDLVLLVDDGTLCVYGDEPTFLSGPSFAATEQIFEAGSRIHIQVSVPGCLSSSCDINRVASCAVLRDENVLTVSSHLSYEETDEVQCTMDCGVLTANCESEELEVGSYTVRHGEYMAALQVPSTAPACGQ